MAGELLLVHREMDEQVHPDQTLRLADRLVAAGKDFELLIVPGAEYVFIDRLAYVWQYDTGTDQPRSNWLRVHEEGQP